MLERIELSKAEIEAVREQIVSVLMSEPRISFAYLHGSFGSRPFRDIDIAAYCEVPEEEVFDFELETALRIETVAGYTVDFKAINYAPVGFQFSAINEGELMCERDGTLRVDFIEDVGARYMDYYELSKGYFRELVECIKR